MSSSDDQHQQKDDDGSGQDTSAFSFDLDDELETPSGAAEPEVATEELPTGSALLVVARGRNAGARFLFRQPVTTAGRLPGSDILLDDITSADDTPSFESKTDNTASWTSAASTKPMSTVDQSNQRSWPTATRYKSADSVSCS